MKDEDDLKAVLAKYFSNKSAPQIYAGITKGDVLISINRKGKVNTKGYAKFLQTVKKLEEHLARVFPTKEIDITIRINEKRKRKRKTPHIIDRPFEGKKIVIISLPIKL